jgi:serine/threonine-protein kinase
MKIKLITLLLICISTSLFAQDDWQTYEKDNYAINFPADWEYSDFKPQPLVAFMLYSPETSQTEDKFRENINLTIEELSSADYTLDQYTEIALDQVKKQIPTAKMISILPASIGELDATNVVWSADFGNGTILQFNQLFTIKDRIAYVLTFTATATEYDIYIKDGIKILNSFKFTK